LLKLPFVQKDFESRWLRKWQSKLKVFSYTLLPFIIQTKELLT